MRHLYVYTPPGYDPKKTYPTLYLLGGSGELPSNWMYDGRANLILDNLIAEGKAVPMVMVLPNNQIIHRNHLQHAEQTFKLFEKELRDHIVPLVESKYNVRHDPGEERCRDYLWVEDTPCSAVSIRWTSLEILAC